MPGWPGGLGNRLQDGRAAVDQGLGDRLQAEPGLIDQWKASLANRILSAPSKLFGGLVVDPAMDLATLAGDVIHGRQPTMAADPQTGEFHTDPRLIDRTTNAAGMLTLGAGAIPAEANSLRMGIKAYHGSPHDFERFDSSKIGTGEGAQSFGHGMYFAEAEPVAKQYRDNLAGYKFVQDALKAGKDKRPAQVAEWLYADPHMTDEHMAEALRVLDDKAPPEQIKAWVRDGKQLLATSKDAGRMYQVDIAADPEHFLDWDKPLSEQSPQVREPLSNAVAAERLHHTRTRDTEMLSGAALTPSFSEKGYGGLPAPSRRIMVQRVLAVLDNPQVREDVVGLVPIDVMNVLSRKEGSPVSRLHDATVLFDKLAASRGDDVSLGVDRATSTIIGIANAAAKRLPGDAGVVGMPSELRSALRANKGDHDKPLGSWFPQGQNTSKWLSEQGISGTKYLDQGSRGKGTVVAGDGKPTGYHNIDAELVGRFNGDWNAYKAEYTRPDRGSPSLKEAIKELDARGGVKFNRDEGTRNYVVFDDKLISILRKYGLPISAAGLAALSQLHPEEAKAAQPLGDRLQGR